MPYANPAVARAFQAQYYETNKSSWKAYNKKSRKIQTQEAREYVAQIKQRPCMDCGVAYPPYVMQFDHRDPSQKKFMIGCSVTRGLGSGVLRAEIAKCDIVCANCHAERTHKQRQTI